MKWQHPRLSIDARVSDVYKDLVQVWIDIATGGPGAGVQVGRTAGV
jgi:hypothetical protein